MLLPSPVPPSAPNLESSQISDSPSSNSRSLRSLALLLNDLPSASDSPTCSSFNNQLIRGTRPNGVTDSSKTPYPQNGGLDSQNRSCEAEDERGQKQSFGSQYSSSPPTKTTNPPSPSAYNSYRPEWTSVSSPILPSCIDDPNHQPPRKKTRAIDELESSHQPAQDYHESRHHAHNHHSNHQLSTRYSRHSFHPIRPMMSLDQDELSNNNEDDSQGHPNPAAISRPVMMDDDRGLSSRPLKNTKRAAQNRAAQRAFRERKDRYVRELEARSAQFEDYIMRHGLLEERERVLAAREAEVFYQRPRDINGLPYVNHLEQQLERAKREVATLRLQIYPKTQQSTGCQNDPPPSSSSTTWEQSSSQGDGPCFAPSTANGSASDLAGRRGSTSSTSSFFSPPDTATEFSPQKQPGLLHPSRSYPPMNCSENPNENDHPPSFQSRRPLLSITIGGTPRVKPEDSSFGRMKSSDRISPDSMSQPYSAPCLTDSKPPLFEGIRMSEDEKLRARLMKPTKESIRLPAIHDHHRREVCDQQNQAWEPTYSQPMSAHSQMSSDSRSDNWFKHPADSNSRASRGLAALTHNSNSENQRFGRHKADHVQERTAGER